MLYDIDLLDLCFRRHAEDSISTKVARQYDLLIASCFEKYGVTDLTNFEKWTGRVVVDKIVNPATPHIITETWSLDGEVLFTINSYISLDTSEDGLIYRYELKYEVTYLKPVQKETEQKNEKCCRNCRYLVLSPLCDEPCVSCNAYAHPYFEPRGGLVDDIT